MREERRESRGKVRLSPTQNDLAVSNKSLYWNRTAKLNIQEVQRHERSDCAQMARRLLCLFLCGQDTLRRLPAAGTAEMPERKDLSIIKQREREPLGRCGVKNVQGVWQPPDLHAMVTIWPRQRRKASSRSAAGRIMRHTQALVLPHGLQPSSAVVSAVVVGTSFVSLISA